MVKAVIRMGIGEDQVVFYFDIANGFVTGSTVFLLYTGDALRKRESQNSSLRERFPKTASLL